MVPIQREGAEFQLPPPGSNPHEGATVAFAPGTRKLAKAAVKVMAALPANDQWVDNPEGVSPMDLVYNPALHNLPERHAETQQGGKILVNQRPMVDYFREPRHLEQILLPFDVAGLDYRTWHVQAKVFGGGLGAQAESVRLGLARALTLLMPELAPAFNAERLLRQDPRIKLPKLPGLRGHRRAKQWSKR